MSLDGLDFDAAVDAIMHAAREGVRDAAELVRRDSDRLVPVDEGDLRESSRVEMRGQAEAVVTYGTPHATIVHEKVEIGHPNGGQAKYLETALLSNAGEVARRISTAAWKAGR